MNKLTAVQKEIMKLMQEGWELGMYWSQVHFSRIAIRITLQQGGLGSGGETRRIRTRETIYSLVRMGLIAEPVVEGINDNPKRFILTTKGHEMTL